MTHERFTEYQTNDLSFLAIQNSANHSSHYSMLSPSHPSQLKSASGIAECGMPLLHSVADIKHPAVRKIEAPLLQCGWGQKTTMYWQMLELPTHRLRYAVF
jgi:hypothetical protein